MNFLELCQTTRELAGIKGTGPTTTVAQSGELLRLVHWVQKSWIDIQNLHRSWNFLLSDLSFTTTQSKGDYTPTDMGAADLKLLDVNSLRCNITALGISNRNYMERWDYKPFRDLYRYTNYSEGRPIRFAVNPQNKAVCFAAIPDATSYTITGLYWKKAVTLSADTDIPAIPDDFHMLIPYWALSKYAGYEAATEAKQEAVENKARILTALEADQLPDMYLEVGL